MHRLSRPQNPMAACSTHLRLIVVAFALGTVACGGGDGDAAAPDTTVADSATDTTSDAVTDIADTLDVADSLGTDTQSPDAADTAPTGDPCSALVACAVKCPAKGDDACLTNCVAKGSTTAKAELATYNDCVVAECADATETQARNACGLQQCWEPLSACAGLGQGDSDCMDTAACAAQCVTGDLPCQFTCLQGGTKDAAVGYAGISACILANCGTKQPGAQTDECIATSCANAAAACTAEGGLDCLESESCLSHCPAFLPSKPNHCPAVCDLVTSAGAMAIRDSFEACKATCDTQTNKFACVVKTCTVEQQACFGGTGVDNCNMVYNCVKAECEGVGGSPACVRACLDKGTAAAQDAFVQYEGCLLNQMDTTAAQTYGCAFPYDEVTCIKQVAGYCSPEYAACFPN
jgi:hypothetical protein